MVDRTWEEVGCEALGSILRFDCEHGHGMSGMVQEILKHTAMELLYLPFAVDAFESR